MSDSTPLVTPFPPTPPTTYLERVQKYFRRTDPRHLFRSDEEIRRCRRIVKAAEEGRWSDVRAMGVASEAKVLYAHSVNESCVHPTSLEPLPIYGRMASFVPANIPICSGMVLATPTVVNNVFWQWVNQTYNAAFNFANAVKNTPNEKEDKAKDDYSDIMKAYGGAVAVSVGLAVGLTGALKRCKISASLKSALQKVVPYTAVASAGMSNVVLMRSNELTTGIAVHGKDGEYLGHSKKAAQTALLQTAISRAVLAAPILALPPPLCFLMWKFPWLGGTAARRLVTEVAAVTLGVVVGLPLAVAVFPEEALLPTEKVEEEIRKKANGAECVKFNKGL